MAQDFYGEAQALAEALRLGGAEGAFHADAIEEAIAAGSTATEILMRLSHELRAVTARGLGVSSEHKERAESLANDIDQVLVV